MNYLKLESVNSSNKRPLWSVVIPTYNCAHYLKETLSSVLAQDLGPEQMEIIVVDDHSTEDDPEAVVKQYGQGRVQFIRQAKNVGKVRNYETGLQATTGLYIHQLHGDDMVLPGFYKTMTQLLEAHPKAGAAFCRTLYMDGEGQWTGMTGMLQEQDGIVAEMLPQLYVKQQIQTPSMVVKRAVYENIGAFDRRLDCLEDWEMWIRIAHSYPIAMTNEVLALYRTHSHNATQETFQNGTALTTHQAVLNIVDGYVPPEIKKQYRALRNQKQAEFLWLSYRGITASLKPSERLKFMRAILKKEIKLKYLYGFIKHI